MKNLKQIWKAIKEPRKSWLLLFYILFIIIVSLTLYRVVTGKSSFFDYILYFLSAMFLTYAIYSLIIIIPKAKQFFNTKLQKNKFTKNLIENYGTRTIFFTFFSFLINTAFVLFQGILAVITLSPWYFSLTFYYLVLSVTKAFIFRKNDNLENFETRTYKKCGIALILLSIIFSGCILLTYTSNMTFKYSGITIYAVAVYTFYKLTMAIIHTIKSLKQSDLLVRCSRNLNLASALTSLVVLQIAMIVEFSIDTSLNYFNALTGGIVFLFITSLGLYMIIKSNKLLKLNIN